MAGRTARFPPAALGRAEVGPGTQLTPERLNRLGELADEEGAFRTLLRALERRAFASADLGRRLARKGHRPDAVASALARAGALGLLDDAAFARDFVETRAARGRGPARLTRDLLAMGVDRRHIDAALAAAVAGGVRPLGHASGTRRTPGASAG